MRTEKMFNLIKLCSHLAWQTRTAHIHTHSIRYATNTPTVERACELVSRAKKLRVVLMSNMIPVLPARVVVHRSDARALALVGACGEGDTSRHEPRALTVQTRHTPVTARVRSPGGEENTAAGVGCVSDQFVS